MKQLFVMDMIVLMMLGVCVAFIVIGGILAGAH